MKKLIAISLAVLGITTIVNAQGTFAIDSTFNGGDGATSTSTSGGLVFINGVLDTGTDINLSVLWGTSSSSVVNVLNLDPGGVNTVANTAWLAAQGTGGGDIVNPANGSISDPNGNSYAVTGEAAGTLIYVQLFGWTGNSDTFAGAQPGDTAGSTSVFTVTLAANTAQPQPDIRNMSSLDLITIPSVPEPTSLALAGLGGFGMLMALRRKQA
jgi:hypothetical protein